MLYKTDSINCKEVFMQQQQQRAKPAICVKLRRSAALLLCLMLLGITGCQQPAKPLVKEIKTEKSSQKPAKPEKPSNGNGGNTNNGQNGGGSGNNQNSEQGEITYKGLDIPKSLARSPQKLREMIIQERQIGDETKPQFNEQGKIVKYIEKEVEYDISAAFDDNLLLDPAQNSIYPGAVLRGDSLDNESYQEITEGNKRKATISFDLQGVKDKEGKDGKAGITSDAIFPNLASYRDLHNRILSQSITYHASASSSYEEMEITNEKSLEAQLKIGVGFGAAGIKSTIASGFKFKDGKQKERRLIKFVETFYTVDVNQEAAPLMINIPREKVGDKMPVYVSSVSYGRIAYLTIESEQEKSEFKANFDAVFKVTTTNKGDVDLDAAFKKLNKGTTIKIHTIGGGSKAVTDFKQFQNYIVTEGFSAKNPGRIIKYRLRFLDDNALAYIKYDEKYKTVERIEVPAKGYKVTATVKNIKYTGHNSINIFGIIGMQPLNKDKLQKTLLNYSNTGLKPKLLVKLNETANPLGQSNSIIVPSESSVVQLSFNIKGEGVTQGGTNGTQLAFVSDSQESNPIMLSPVVSKLKTRHLQTFTLYRKGTPNEELLFDVWFDVEKES